LLNLHNSSQIRFDCPTAKKQGNSQKSVNFPIKFLGSSSDTGVKGCIASSGIRGMSHKKWYAAFQRDSGGGCLKKVVRRLSAENWRILHKKWYAAFQREMGSLHNDVGNMVNLGKLYVGISAQYAGYGIYF
jgi:hypothetical protein